MIDSENVLNHIVENLVKEESEKEINEFQMLEKQIDILENSINSTTKPFLISLLSSKYVEFSYLSLKYNKDPQLIIGKQNYLIFLEFTNFELKIQSIKATKYTTKK